MLVDEPCVADRNGNGSDGGSVAALALPNHKQLWKLVWCRWQQCHPQERILRRQFTNNLLKPFGGELLPLIKEKTITWLQSDLACPCVLVTDWRNAKPIMEQLQDEPGCIRPRLTVVLCKLRTQIFKAVKWMQTLPPSIGPVFACGEDEIPWSILGGMIQQCFSSSVCDSHASDDSHPSAHYVLDPHETKNEKASGNRNKDYRVDGLQTVPEAGIKRVPRFEGADENSNECMPPIKELKEVSLFPFNMPAPATLVRGPGGVLTVRCN